MNTAFAPAALSEIPRNHLFFERQQSYALRHMDWEDRVKPLTPWSTIMLRVLGALAVIGAVTAFII